MRCNFYCINRSHVARWGRLHVQHRLQLGDSVGDHLDVFYVQFHAD